MKKVGIVMGSDSDLPVIQKAVDMLRTLEIPCEVHVYSAHRTPEEARRFAVRFQIPLTVIPGGDHRLSIPGAPELVLERAAAFFLGRS